MSKVGTKGMGCKMAQKMAYGGTVTVATNKP